VHRILDTDGHINSAKMALLEQFARGALPLGRNVCCAGLLACLAAGCAQHNVYHAHSLPGEFQASEVPNPKTIDLSRLASFAVSNELIDRGDVLELTLVTGYGRLDTTTTPIRVGDDGTANVPLVGKVELAGMELADAEHAIASAGVYRGVFRNPHVTVTMKRPRVNKVTVIGAVEEPGVYDLPRGSSALLAALVAAGGLSDEAGTEVEIRRPQRGGRPDGMPLQQVPRERLAGYVQGGPIAEPVATPASSARIDLVSAAQEGRGGYYLDDGDVVMVESRDPKPIHVLGLVRKPGQYELPTRQEMHLLDAIAVAGGLDIPWAENVIVIRHVPGRKEPVLIKAKLSQAKRDGKANLRLAAGDVVSVEQTPATVMYDVIRKFNVGLGASLF
jgi:polysaccharide export outer membrane protein